MGEEIKQVEDRFEEEASDERARTDLLFALMKDARDRITALETP